jgi:triosephosphate isomerase
MRTPVIAGNWKLFKTADEAITLVHELAGLVNNISDVEIVVAPVFTVLSRVNTALAETSIRLAAQDCFWEEEGAFTGEVSCKMLLDAGCSHVIIGHSERRQLFGETDATVNRKIRAAAAAGLVPIFCIGETLAEREENNTFSVLEKQLTNGLAGLSKAELTRLIVAYEPVWAIGTGRTATDSQAQEVHEFVRGVIAGLYTAEFANGLRIIYGGSVKPDNIKGLIAQQDIDGALVGGASLQAASFATIVRLGE